MKRLWPPSSGVSWLAPAVLLVLLGTLATLQYRWAGELSEGEGARLRASARSRAEAMGLDFDRELTRAFQHLQLEPEALRAHDFAAYAREYGRWRAEASHPDLVKDVLLVERGEAAALHLSRFDASQANFVPLTWPGELAPLQERLSGRGRGPMGLVLPEFPAVLIPVAPGPPPDGRGFRPGPAPPGSRPPPSGMGAPPRLDGRREPPPRGFGPPDVVVLMLDLTYVRERFLPALAERHFGGPHGLDYSLAVLTRDEPPREVWRSSPGVAPLRPADASAGLLDVRFEDAGGPGRGFVSGGRGGPREPPGSWRLVAVHAGGSIDHAVAVARWRNLAVGLSILLLLGASVAVMMVAARRAELLGRQQMEFVAGVSHDLRTPLAVIRSAAENLADGLVLDAAQVRSYGTLVRDEGRRLSDMVEQVLELAGADAGRARETAPVDVGALLDDALRACEPELRTAGVVAERSVPNGLPRVMGDAGALRRAVRNLVENALKHGGDVRWIGVRAGAAAGQREVWVAVEDRGPGVAPEDLPRIFEPFYRGRDAAARQVAGSGLGLSLVRRIVESHGGRVTVERGHERGSVFTIRLPAIAESAAGGPP